MNKTLQIFFQLIVLLFLAAPAGADPVSCKVVLKNTADAEWRKTLQKLEELPPVGLDTPSLNEGLKSYWKEMGQLNAGLKNYELIRDYVADGEMGKAEATRNLDELAEWSSEVASQQLRKMKTKDSNQLRKQLESQRILLKAISSLRESLNSQTGSAKGADKVSEKLKKKLQEAAERRQQKEQGQQPSQKNKKSRQQQQQEKRDQQSRRDQEQNSQEKSNDHKSLEERIAEQREQLNQKAQEKQEREARKQSAKQQQQEQSQKSDQSQQHERSQKREQSQNRENSQKHQQSDKHQQSQKQEQSQQQEQSQKSDQSQSNKEQQRQQQQDNKDGSRQQNQDQNHQQQSSQEKSQQHNKENQSEQSQDSQQNQKNQQHEKKSLADRIAEKTKEMIKKAQEQLSGKSKEETSNQQPQDQKKSKGDRNQQNQENDQLQSKQEQQGQQQQENSKNSDQQDQQSSQKSEKSHDKPQREHKSFEEMKQEAAKNEQQREQQQQSHSQKDEQSQQQNSQEKNSQQQSSQQEKQSGSKPQQEKSLAEKLAEKAQEMFQQAKEKLAGQEKSQQQQQQEQKKNSDQKSGQKDQKSGQKDQQSQEQGQKSDQQEQQSGEQGKESGQQQDKQSGKDGQEGQQSKDGQKSDQQGKQSGEGQKSDQQGKQSGQQGKDGQQQGKQSGEGQKSDQQGKQSGQQGKEGQQSGKGQEGQQQGKQSGESQKSDQQGKQSGEGQKNTQKGQQQGNRSDQKGQQEKAGETSAGKGEGDRQESESLFESLKNSFLNSKKEKEDEPKKPEAKKEASPEKKSGESLFDKFFGKDKKDTKKQGKKDPKPVEIDRHMKEDTVQKALLKSYLIHALRQYSSSESLLESLKSFYMLSNSVGTRGNDSARQFATLANELRNNLEPLSVQYPTLDSFAADVATQARTNVSAVVGKLHFLEKTLSTLKKQTSLTTEEEAMLTALQSALGKLTSKTDPTDEEVVNQFLKQMSGPLSRKSLKDKFQHGGQLDYRAAAESIRSGNMNSLLTLSGLKRFTRFNSFTRPYPSKRWVHTGYKLPIDDVEPALEAVEDFTNIKNIFRDGPVDKDLVRLAAGDLLEYTYRERQAIKGTKNPKDREVYIMLYDMSGSMGHQSKYIFQAGAMASVLDSAQIKVAQGNKISFVAIPFGDSPGTPTKIKSSAETAQFFETMMDQPPMGSSGTSITSALVKAFEMIKEAQMEGGELGRAHVLILTDGADSINFDTVNNAKAEVMEKTAISFHAVTIGEGNEHLKILADQGLSPGQKARSSYQYFNYDQIAQIMDTRQNIEALEMAAKNNSIEEGASLNTQDVSYLTGRVSKLALHSEEWTSLRREDQAFLQTLKETAKESEVDLAEYIDPIFELQLGDSLLPSQQKAARVQFVRHYLEALSKELKSTEEGLVKELTQEQRQQLLDWISK